jgi:PKD repeat protein
MNASQVRVGVLLSPINPLWTGTVVAYTTATFELEVTPKAGISASLVGWFIDLAGKFIRIRDVDVSGANAILTLAPNGLTFTAADVVNIYNVIYPAPKLERRQTNVTTWAGGGVPGRFTNWRFTNAGGYTSLWWQIDPGYHPGKVCIHSDASMDDDSLVGVIIKALGTQTIKAKNNSGLSGSVTINNISNGSGTITIVPYVVSKDWDITWNSLGGTIDERDRASQGPVAIVNPECVVADVGEPFDISADGSYATFDGANVPATIRYPATIAPTDYVWTPGTDGTVISGQNTPNAHISYSTAGFRYLKLVVTDSNTVTQTRYIPVWIGITPAPVDSVTIPWAIGRDSSLELEFKSPPTFLRHSLVCLVDLDTQEPLYLGYAWPASVNYDFEKSTLRLTAYQALTFLAQVYYYPFILTGQKGGSIDWDHFDMYSVPRGAVFLLRWHSNYLTIANAEWDIDTALVPSGACCDRRLRYIQPMNAGTLLDELRLMAQEAFYSIYPLPLGGFRVLPSLLYGSAITGTIAETGVDSDTLTLPLTDAEMRIPVDRVLGIPTMSEVTLWGNYHTGFPALNFYSIKVKAPRQPEAYGRPAEVPNLLSSTTNAPGDPGYWEMLRWAARHVGLANYANTYSLRPLADVDLLRYPMVDIPDPADPLATVRVVVESKTIEFHPDGHADVELTGRDFGITVSSVVAPADPTPGVDPTNPIPVPDTLVADFVGVPVTGFAPLTVAFTDLTTGGTPTQWAWDFGDGATDTVQNPTHIYTVPGLYTVSLTVTTATGQTDTETKIEYIEVLAPVGFALMVNPTQMGRTLDYTAVAPTWDDLKTGALLGGNVGKFTNAALAPNGAAWVVTYKDLLTLADNGLWYCPDVFGAAPAFTLICSHSDYRTLTGDALTTISSLGCDDDGTAYISGVSNMAGFGRYAYGINSMTLGTNPNLPTDGQQFQIGSGASVRLAVGTGGVPEYGVFELDGGSATRVYNVLDQVAPDSVGVGYFVHDAPTLVLYSYVDSGGSHLTPTLIYSGVAMTHPLSLDGGYVLTIRDSDGNLMDGAGVLDTPAHAFGAARDFGGYCVDAAGNILAVTNTAAGDHFIIISTDGGATWDVKDGDWVTAMGANWYGGLGAGEACAMILTL